MGSPVPPALDILPPYFVGIDPGQKGGIVALGDDGDLLWWRGILCQWRMPVIGREYDAIGLIEIMRKLESFERDLVVTIERMQGPPKGTKAIEARGYARMFRFLFMARGHKASEVTSREWQPAMLKHNGQGTTKQRALRAAHRRWGYNFTPSGCRKPHDGLVDAALIAEYGRIKRLNSPRTD